MTEQNISAPRQRRAGNILLEFIGSMNLAISLLVVIGIASMIGTVLKQNEPYNNYIIKFGDFWFEVFKALGLFDIYGSNWFLLLLGFLLLSTSICVWRNAPRMLHEMRTFRFNVQAKSLRAFHHHSQWQSQLPVDEISANVTALLAKGGYRVKQKSKDGVLVLAGLRGVAGRVGYILTHLAIVVICFGGMLDGNIPLKLAELNGTLKPETRDLPAADVPAVSTLGVDNNSFRGSVSIPEGSRANFSFLQLRDGYLKQELPFSIALEDFRIEHYPSGMPKSFESDLIIYDDAEGGEPLTTTIRVNHPLIYKGYAIYQSSFADGGSRLKLTAWSFDRPSDEPFRFEGTVNEKLPLETPRGKRTLELDEFKLYNIFPLPDNDPSGKKFRNYGPSFTFKLRRPNGEAYEYQNYMTPVELEGRLFIMTGMRTTPSEEFSFLHIPLDNKGSIHRFMKFYELIRDQERLARAIDEQTMSGLGSRGTEDEQLANDLRASIARLAKLFIEQGLQGLVDEMEARIEPAKRQEALDAYVQVLQGVLGSIYIEMLAEDGVDVANGVNQTHANFFDDALSAISAVAAYDSPFYLELNSFDHVEASGLQITKSPGKDVVYFGSALLIAGIFFMFYLHPRKLWLRIETNEEGSQLLFAGNSLRNHADFDDEFAGLSEQLRHASGATVVNSSDEPSV